MQGYHKSVLIKEVLDILNIKKNDWYLDCTLGDGGHSLEILNRGGKVVGIDVDPQALERARNRLQATGCGQQDFKLIQGNFRDLENLIQKPASPAKRGEQTDTSILLSAGTSTLLSASKDNRKFAGAIFDLGVSSLQLESPLRGFSFAKRGPLDMRMDPNLKISALDLINSLSRKELYEIFKILGEEKFSKRLVDTMVSARQVKPITQTVELAEIIARAIGKKDKIHPATRVFQALRIVVNDELRALGEGLDSAKELIDEGGKIAVISFHSLEDRIVKTIFKDWDTQGIGRILTKKPIVPSQQEIDSNPRSRSAKLRAFEIESSR